jgi:putative flippase GtrA
VIAQFLSRQFLQFLLVGGTAAIVNFLSRIAYSRWLDFSTAVILAYVTGMVVAFVLARVFVFGQTSQPVGRSAGLFVLVNLVGVAQSWAISMALALYVLPMAGVVEHAQAIAHAIGVAVPAFTSYLGHKRWSFR